MGLISWIKREKKGFDEQTPTPGFTIGVPGLSVSQNRKWQKETIRVIALVTEDKTVDFAHDETFFQTHVFLGYDGNIPVFRKKTKDDDKNETHP